MDDQSEIEMIFSLVEKTKKGETLTDEEIQLSEKMTSAIDEAISTGDIIVRKQPSPFGNCIKCGKPLNPKGHPIIKAALVKNTLTGEVGFKHNRCPPKYPSSMFPKGVPHCPDDEHEWVTTKVRKGAEWAIFTLRCLKCGKTDENIMD